MSGAACTHIHARTHMHTHTCTHTHTYMHTHTQACTHVHVCTCMHTHTHTNTHAHTHKHTHTHIMRIRSKTLPPCPPPYRKACNGVYQGFLQRYQPGAAWLSGTVCVCLSVCVCVSVSVCVCVCVAIAGGCRSAPMPCQQALPVLLLLSLRACHCIACTCACHCIGCTCAREWIACTRFLSLPHKPLLCILVRIPTYIYTNTYRYTSIHMLLLRVTSVLLVCYV